MASRSSSSAAAKVAAAVAPAAVKAIKVTAATRAGWLKEGLSSAAAIGAAKEALKVQTASTLDLLVAGLAADTVLGAKVAFVIGEGGNVERATASLSDYLKRENCPAFLNAAGAVSAAALSGFKRATLLRFGLPADTGEAGFASAWALLQAKALPLAAAAVAEGVTVALVEGDGGKLKLTMTGGAPDSAKAKLLVRAKSTSAAVTVAKGEVAKRKPAVAGAGQGKASPAAGGALRDTVAPLTLARELLALLKDMNRDEAAPSGAFIETLGHVMVQGDALLRRHGAIA